MASAADDGISAATAYEDLHVPALFEQWAATLAEAAEVQRGQRVLDVACGTGVLAREAASRVGPEGSVAGLDADRGMLAVADRLAPEIQWRHGMAESLPFPSDSFDVVVSQFGLMFFRDRSEGLREMVAGSGAADALRAPFVLGDRKELQTLFRNVGVESVQIVTRSGTARFPSVRTMVEAELRGWLPVMGVVLPEEQIERILEEAELALGDYVTPSGALEFDMPALIGSGTKP